MHNKKISLSLLIGALTILLWLSACSQKPKANCPVPNSNATVSGGETVSEIEQSILDYLNQGGSAEQLQMELNKLQDTSIIDRSQVISVDTDSDGIQEIVLSINYGPPKSGDYLDVHGNLYIYNCDAGKYNATLIVGREFADTQKILAVENLLGSDTLEILILRRWTYLDIYFEAVEMYMLTEVGWNLSFKSEETPCGIQTELREASNRRKELIIIAGNDCSNRGDQSRIGKKSVYAFEDNEVKLLQEEPLPSP
jgi:hypothetical protein